MPWRRWSPEWLVNFWEAMYRDPAEVLPAEGPMAALRCKFEAGVAQGDPGSGSLFLIVIEGLLLRITAIEGGHAGSRVRRRHRNLG